MEKINFSDLNLEVDNSTTEIEFNGQKLEVLKYLPCQDKYDLLLLTLEQSYEEGIYDSFKVDMFFHLNLALAYCKNLYFSEEEYKNGALIYDMMKSSGLLDIIIEAINDIEYEELYVSLNELIEIKTQYNNTIFAFISKMLKEFGPQMSDTLGLVKNFNPEQFKNIIDFVNVANGNRDFETNIPITEEEEDIK